MGIRLLKKGIRIGKDYRPVWYSGSSGNINGNATIYFKEYGLPEGWYTALSEIGVLKDETDTQTDYFEKPRIKVKPDSKYFQTVINLSEGN